MGRLIMAYWDCKWCQTKGIPGDKRECPNCSRPRGDVKFYMKNNLEGKTYTESERAGIEYVEEDKAKKVNRGADWYCPYCDSLNTFGNTTCKGCGATVEDSDKNYFDIQKEKKEAEKPKQPVTPPPQRKQNWLKPLLIAAGIIAILAIIFWPRTKDASISEVSWMREIGIEENVLCSEDDWSLPNGAELTRTAEEIHHYDQVLDHYESREVQRSRQVLDHYETRYTTKDLGNGYFEEESYQEPVYTTEYYYETVQDPVYIQVPRYQTKYYYTIWRWKECRQVKDNGTGHTEKWPDFNLGEKEREGAHRETYYVTIRVKDKDTTYKVDSYSAWQTLNSGDEVKIKGNSKLLDKDENLICELDKQ